MIADQLSSSPLEAPSSPINTRSSDSEYGNDDVEENAEGETFNFDVEEEEEEEEEEKNEDDNEDDNEEKDINNDLPDILEFGINAKGTYSCYLDHPDLGGKWVASDKIPEIMLGKVDERIEYIKKQLQYALTVQARLLVKYNDHSSPENLNQNKRFVSESPIKRCTQLPTIERSSPSERITISHKSSPINSGKAAKRHFSHLMSEELDSTQLVLNTMDDGDEKKCIIM